MIITCNHCQKKITGGDKLRASLEKLTPGQTLRLKCPHCGQPISLTADILNEKQDASPNRQNTSTPTPPPAPDPDWLDIMLHKESGGSEVLPKALILMHDSASRATLASGIEELGFLPFFPDSVSSAKERLRLSSYEMVILHSGYEGSSLADSTFHTFMRAMKMNRRRSILYVLLGPEFHTLYDLEALSLSANLVMNEKELPMTKTVLRRALNDHRELFDPFTEEIDNLTLQ
ncbi:MAG: hypothetical protein H8E79_08130 [Desulfobulbaceae bacterium]|uniref:Zinc finger/thioredoxin putative domain-containing protein n=1 Tax=Candidatus Desulfatifera sulfidica TaxID=2841691 RepID=A0A8J6N909_9BACT|nr:hypothetical protein [Candidatus Desulfatifera sulfidica]